jgi:antitoxin ParD1/3/4
MEVSLTPDLERWIAERVAAGEFESESAAIRAGLVLLQKRQERLIKLEALRRDVDVSIEQLDRGEGVDGEEVFEEALGWIAAQREDASEAA